MTRKESESAIGGIRGAWSLKLGVVRDPDAAGTTLGGVTRRLLGAESASSLAVYIAMVLFIPLGLMAAVATAQLGVTGLSAQFVILGFLALYAIVIFFASFIRRQQSVRRLWREFGPSLREIEPIADYPLNPLSLSQWNKYRTARKERLNSLKGVENRARSDSEFAKTIHQQIWAEAVPFEGS